MKQITFEFVSIKDGKIADLISMVDELANHVEFDFNKNTMIFSELFEDKIEPAVDFVNKFYKNICKIKISDFSKSDKGTETMVESNKSTISLGNLELYIIDTFNEAFEKIDAQKSVKENINTFLDNIGLDKDAPFIFKSFLIGTKIKRISYENIVLELKKEVKNISEEGIIREIKKTFDKFLDEHKEVKERYSKISITCFIKMFVKKLNAK